MLLQLENYACMKIQSPDEQPTNRNHGGQATLGLFGLPGSRPSTRPEAKPEPAALSPFVGESPASIQRRTARRDAALAQAARFARLEARLKESLNKAAAIKLPAPAATEIVPDLLLDGEQYAELERIARVEDRSVNALIRLATREFVERRAAKQEETEPKATAAMNAVARARDMREAFPHITDDEQAEFQFRCLGGGYVDIQLAQD